MPVFYRNDFQFVLGAPQASQHKTTEIPTVYLNKGQFYPITLQGVDSNAGVSCSKVKVSYTLIDLNNGNKGQSSLLLYICSKEKELLVI